MACCQSNGFSNSILAIKLYFFYICSVKATKVAPPSPFLNFLTGKTPSHSNILSPWPFPVQYFGNLVCSKAPWISLGPESSDHITQKPLERAVGKEGKVIGLYFILPVNKPDISCVVFFFCSPSPRFIHFFKNRTFYNWITGKDRPSSGSLIQVITTGGKTELVSAAHL